MSKVHTLDNDIIIAGNICGKTATWTHRYGYQDSSITKAGSATEHNTATSIPLTGVSICPRCRMGYVTFDRPITNHTTAGWPRSATSLETMHATLLWRFSFHVCSMVKQNGALVRSAKKVTGQTPTSRRKMDAMRVVWGAF